MVPRRPWRCRLILRVRLSAFIFLFSSVVALGIEFGINYGQVANNLPTPTAVAALLRSLSVNRVKLYDANPEVLTAFADSGIEFIVAIGNEDLVNMTDSRMAQAWVQQNVQPYLPRTKITCITVGNEVLSGNDTTLVANLLPAMQSVYQALVNLGLDSQVSVSSAHSLNILGNSYPPSSGSFRQDLVPYLQPILNFHSQISSPFLVNAYPYFAYKANPADISLAYVLFEPNPGVTDPNTNLNYDNMLYAQIDSVHSAIKAFGYSNIDVRISESGWPSQGDEDEPGATVQNAQAYNTNLLQRIAGGEGTPLNPSVPINVYVFALFNEDLKPGPTSERNYGLFYPNGRPVYSIGLLESASLLGKIPGLASSSRRTDKVITYLTTALALILAVLI